MQYRSKIISQLCVDPRLHTVYMHLINRKTKRSVVCLVCNLCKGCVPFVASTYCTSQAHAALWFRSLPVHLCLTSTCCPAHSATVGTLHAYCVKLCTSGAPGQGICLWQLETPSALASMQVLQEAQSSRRSAAATCSHVKPLAAVPNSFPTA